MYSGGDHNRGARTAKRCIASTVMMLLDHGSDGEPKVDAQLGQHPPHRNTVSTRVGVLGLLSCLKARAGHIGLRSGHTAGYGV